MNILTAPLQQIRWPNGGPLFLCLLLCLPSCAGRQEKVLPPEKVVVREAPPAVFTAPTPVPDYPDTMTNGDLAKFSQRLRALLLMCNGDKSDIVQWAATPAVQPPPDKPPEPPKRKYWFNF